MIIVSHTFYVDYDCTMIKLDVAHPKILEILFANTIGSCRKMSVTGCGCCDGKCDSCSISMLEMDSAWPFRMVKYSTDVTIFRKVAGLGSCTNSITSAVSFVLQRNQIVRHGRLLGTSCHVFMFCQNTVFFKILSDQAYLTSKRDAIILHSLRVAHCCAVVFLQETPTSS